MQNTDLKNNIEVTHNISESLTRHISNYNSHNIYILCDENTYEYCFPEIKNIFSDEINIIKIKSGEEYKNVTTLQKIWNFLQKNNADRNSLLINLGGGVITDIGGFAASTFKRGIDFINIPTTLLAQIDASIGGKNGINYSDLKNEIGTINLAQKVIVDTQFLKTLNKEDFSFAWPPRLDFCE